MVKGGRQAGDNTGTRQCAVTHDMLTLGELIRFVESPDGSIVPDIKADLPGRGVWISCRWDIVARALATGAFARSLNKKVNVDPDMADRLDELLLKRAIERLSLATKAGLVTSGFVKVSKRLEKGNFIALLHATDGAPDGKRKLDALLRKAAIEAGEQQNLISKPIEILSIMELSLATGRENVVHAALAKGGASSSFLQELARLMNYRGNAD